MYGFRSTSRSRRRFALIIAIAASATVVGNGATAQMLADPTGEATAESRAESRAEIEVSSLPDVFITPRQSLPPGVLSRRTYPASPDEVPPSENGSVPEEPAKSTFVFSPIEMRPIRQSAPVIPLPPEIAARRGEIERKSLERIFAGGMIASEANVQFSLAKRGQIGDAVVGKSNPPEAIIAMAPQEPELPLDGLPLDDLPLLPEPPLASEKLEQMPPGTIVPGMIEDPDFKPIEVDVAPMPRQEMIDGGILQSAEAPVIDSANAGAKLGANAPVQALPEPIIIPQNGAIHEPPSAIQPQLPNYSLPEGGLDIYQLAPTRFGRPLPGVHRVR